MALSALADYYCVTMDYLAGRDAELTTLSLSGLENLGKRIGEFREKRGLATVQLAQSVDISEEYLHQIESGGEIPNMEISMRLLNALKLSPNEAFMDMLNEGYQSKANYIRDIVETLPSEVRHFILDTAVWMANTCKSKNGKKVEYNEKEGHR